MGYVQTAQESSDTIDLQADDLLATLTRFSAETIAGAIRLATGKKKFSIYLSGGGAHNPLLTQWLQELLNVPTLQTTKGKLDLQERLVKEMNGLIDETAETGVKEALFTRFIMQ